MQNYYILRIEYVHQHPAAASPFATNRKYLISPQTLVTVL